MSEQPFTAPQTAAAGTGPQNVPQAAGRQSQTGLETGLPTSVTHDERRAGAGAAQDLHLRSTDPVAEAPIEVLRGTVRCQWIDHNGHLNAGYYLVAFDDAIGPWMEFIGLGAAHREACDVTTFSAQNHVTYVREIGPDEPYSITVQLLGYDRKRIHAFQVMTQTQDGYVAATCEFVSLHIDGPTRRVGPMADAPYRRLGDIWAAHQQLSLPSQVGRTIAVPPSAQAHLHVDLVPQLA
ncbi:thioesterase family protein [Candidatus Poriferisodalis sp.]|uniref:thioesterase family protein n=1 Tax=Candidatus Poriferisodalis sp. TaxID=3101277 RepID=UPI003B0248DB